MKCPTCTDTALVMSDRQGVEIDYCPQCRGVWLDRGELDKLIERSATMAPAPGDSAAPRSQPVRRLGLRAGPWLARQSQEVLAEQHLRLNGACLHTRRFVRRSCFAAFATSATSATSARFATFATS